MPCSSIEATRVPLRFGSSEKENVLTKLRLLKLVVRRAAAAEMCLAERTEGGKRGGPLPNLAEDSKFNSSNALCTSPKTHP